MSILPVKGNILLVTQGVIVQQVNAQGVMGSGIAKVIRDRYPVVFTEYAKVVKPNRPDNGASYVGMLIAVRVTPELTIANLVGQQFYKKTDEPISKFTSYDALDTSLEKLASYLRFTYQDLPSVHYPLLGAVRGGGNWAVIKQIIAHRMAGFDLHLWILPGEQEPA